MSERRTTCAARQPGTDSEEKEAAPVTSVHDPTPAPAMREEKRKLPADLPFQHEYGGGEYYYIRECYVEDYPLVEDFVLTGEDREQNCLTVSGTPGIGKSVFYAYFFEEFWKAHRGEWIVVAISYMPDGALKQFAVFEDGVRTHFFKFANDAMLSNFLCDLEQQLAKLAKEQESTSKKTKKIVLLCDGTPQVSRPNMVVFTSPNEKWFRMNEKDDHFLFMPLWTPDELQEAAFVLELDLDDAEIDRRVEIFGGTARFCLSRDSSKVRRAKKRLRDRIEAITNGAELQNLLLGKMTDFMRHRILHFEPLPDDKGDWATKLASPYIRRKLEGRWQSLNLAAREELRKSLRGVAAAASLSGWIFEMDSHETLRQGCGLRIMALTDGEIAPVESLLTIPKSKNTDEFDADTLSPSLVSFGPYHRPKTMTWESIDSLYLPQMDSDKPVPAKVAAKWIEDNKVPLVLFQMTISESHPVNASGLVYVLKMLGFLKRLKDVKLVFVVPNELVGKFKRQRIVLVTAVGTDSVREIRGIGRATSAFLLSEYGIKTIDDLEKEVKLRENLKRQKNTSNKKPTPKDENPARWAQIVKLWKQHQLTVDYGEQVAAIAQYVGSWIRTDC